MKLHPLAGALLVLSGSLALTCGGDALIDLDNVEDYDGDGITYFQGDCDDEDLTIYPGATESCNSKDDDCDGTTDEDVEITYYLDADGDGYGEATEYVGGCTLGSGAVDNGDDCDDTDSTIYPDAVEECDGIDNDCDDEIDTDASEDYQYVYYADLDEDGYGDAESTYYTCDTEAPDGYVADGTDCDDSDADSAPGEEESCNAVDDDCDGTTDEGFDEDGSGIADCFEEYCNGVDDDNDGTCDEGWDADEDGYTSCGIPCDDVEYELPDGCDPDTDVDDDGILTCSYDCDDDDPDRNPGAEEVCDEDDVDEDCDGDSDEDDEDIDPASQILLYPDIDGDGYGDDDDSGAYYCDLTDGYVFDNSDCDDVRSWINEAATELCNSRDDDCDGEIDEDAGNTWYRDADGDGFGDDSISEQACSQPDDYVRLTGDCDDTAATIYPGATETCNETDDDCDGTADDGVETNDCGGCGDVDEEVCDGEDNDCDGETDEDLTFTTYYADADDDGYGDASEAESLCEEADGYVTDATDCDDTSADIYPDADETCNQEDDDCDGSADEGLDTDTWYRDRDGDGFGGTTSKDQCDQPDSYVASSGDCDDADKNTYPGAAELCDADDNDCDGDTDENTGGTWYFDSDGDGFGLEGITTSSCDTPGTWSSQAGDCDDSDAASYPGATETCDYADNDCDGDEDDGVTNDCGDCGDVPTETCNEEDDDCDGETDEGVQLTLYVDADDDGFGLSDSSEAACEAGDGYATIGGDCDDEDESVYPGGEETCDDLDNDCDDDTDEGLDTDYYYSDDDSDGFGDADSIIESCDKPTGTVTNSLDCDDSEPLRYPGHSEDCDGLDNDCDDAIDEDATVYYLDADGDGFGDGASTKTACSAPDGYVTNDSDCDDTEVLSYPGHAEDCDGVDNDCDGATDEESGTFYADADGDGYGDALTTKDGCTTPNGYVANASDCDDSDGNIFPTAAETCDDEDEDCDGIADEDAGDTWYIDSDDDDYGDSAVSQLACDQPSGWVSQAGDCDDSSDDAYPGGTETCDDVDNDCDGEVDDGLSTSIYYNDGDEDNYGDPSVSVESCSQPEGYVTDNTDCDDTASYIRPGKTDSCDDLDNDCDGDVDEAATFKTYYKDGDGDGYGDPVVSEYACSQPDDYVTNSNDCDDTSDDISPSDSEDCNDIDDDCDNYVDEGTGGPTWYLDEDGDGYGGDTKTTRGYCTAPDGYVGNSEDCDDELASVNPGASELCNDDDNDCDGTSDEGACMCDWEIQWTSVYIDSTEPSNDNICGVFLVDYDGSTYRRPTQDDFCHGSEGTYYYYQPLESGTVEHGTTVRRGLYIYSCLDDDGSVNVYGECYASSFTISFTCNTDSDTTTTKTFSTHPSSSSLSSKFTFTIYRETED